MFPVSTGINRKLQHGADKISCVPREYGDKPYGNGKYFSTTECSP
ncbi:conserved protein of unknown function [Xenorhabdus doucetiae]|uniref:Uncharacterized protein n=1 Tax=Xenorhabdus doucetiae TaxID=351671 RepID=A0A068QVR2_9GAMM|nr:conserved protein of unknown function [Xenorhabdus doucetiae]